MPVVVGPSREALCDERLLYLAQSLFKAKLPKVKTSKDKLPKVKTSKDNLSKVKTFKDKLPKVKVFKASLRSWKKTFM